MSDELEEDDSCTCLDGYPCGCWSPSFCMCKPDANEQDLIEMDGQDE